MPPRGSNPPSNKSRRKPGPPVSGAWIWMIIGLALVAMLLFGTFDNRIEIPYSTFVKLIDNTPENVKKISFGTNDRIFGEIGSPDKLPTLGRDEAETKELLEMKKRFEDKRAVKFVTRRWPFQFDQRLLERLDTLIKNNNLQVDAPEDPYAWVGPLMLFLLPAVLLLGVFIFLVPKFRDPLGGNFLNSYVKSPARRYERGKTRITFEDVAGMQNAKSELQEVVEFLKTPEKFQKLGAQVPRGVLLVGPPGTGKTLLAKAVAGEAGVPFFSINGSEFIQMFVGVGASVTGDTPVLVRSEGRTRLMPIGEFIDTHYAGDAEGFVVPVSGVETLGFEELDSKFKGSSKLFLKGSAWSRVRGVYRHRVTEIHEIHYLGGMVRTTGDHSVFIRTRDGVKAITARELKPGDVLVNLPLKVRGQYSADSGTLHSVRAHAFTEPAEPLWLDVAERNEELEDAYAFAVANRGVMTQSAIAETIGVSQMTVCNWQTDTNLPRGLSDRYSSVRLPERVLVTPELMRLLGYYTAEGRDNGCVQFVFGSHEADLHADCIALGEQFFGLSPKVDHTEDNSTRITFYSAPLGRFFNRHCGNGSRNKHVPEFLWDMSSEYFLAFLEGYTRGDGYVSREGKLCATSVSKQLIQELAWLCAMHGIKAGVRQWFTPGGRVIKNKPLPDETAWTLIIGKTSNPFAPAQGQSKQGKKAIVREIVVKPFDGFVYDFCGCDNEAFFGGEKPILLHNSRVRDLFKNARENSPCIVFVDEVDAVGRMRGTGVGGGSDEREQTLNQILSEMDGFSPSETVIVVAATNRPDVLDAALLRPGRFDRHITIDRPTWQGRMAILKIHTRNKPLSDDVDLESVARGSIGMTGADLRNLANEAALLATREGKNRIDQYDFARAYDRVLMGPVREEVLGLEGRRRTAYHEAGHTLVGWMEPNADPPHKVTIIPRGQALGVTLIPPDEDRMHHGLDYWKAKLAFIMGGRAADRLMYKQAYSGHENDLKQATRLARYMVTHWGMSDRLGPMSFRVGEEHVFLGKELQEPRDFSEGTASVIDEEVQKLLREADERAYSLLDQNRDKLEALVEALLEREELLRDEIAKVLRGEKLPPLERPPPKKEPPVQNTFSPDNAPAVTEA